MDLKVNLASANLLKPKPEDVLNLVFGSVFTDHMFIMEYSNDEWQNARIEPYKPLQIDPAALVLHYGQGIFEGMKAYRRGKDIFLFRPNENMTRFNRSAKRMVMPDVDEEFVLSAISELLKVEREWIPTQSGTSLYIRPTMIATEAKLGVRPSTEYLFYIVLSPVGPYFKEGFSPVGIYVADEHVRAAEGGTGSAKTMGNYAAGLLASTQANNAGYSQVLWLDAKERKYLEEVGTMNICVVFENEIATPPLSGTILSGITRDSVLTLLREWDHNVVERQISMAEVLEGLADGSVKEIFGCGTAAIIAPVGKLHYKGITHTVSDGKIGALTQNLFDELTGIQCGELKDPFNWIYVVNESN
ncbi:MAG: branched-chain amino acid aminotransferase [Candidatus Thorarchaeota archaeon]|nr:branched-chain amino acid aminotransferase [Candidatus Thorarchaeota archaeon]